jgi:bifunctional ADP-heptose synthase (sugar kinase/adenylyltransferase)
MVAQSSDSKKIAEEIRKNLPDKDSRIVFVSGNFNIIHPGHLRLLRFAAECGDFLVVGVQAQRLVEAVGHFRLAA